MLTSALDSPWKAYFRQWPVGAPPTGVVVTSQGEQIPFDGFMTSDTLLMVERKSPDTLGSRRVVLEYKHIAAVKVVDVVKNRWFSEAGFQPGPSRPSH